MTQAEINSTLERNDCGRSEDIQIALKGWVARDKSGEIRLYRTEPNRSTKADVWDALIYDELLIDKTVFPNLTWEDEPLKVVVQLIKENNLDMTELEGKDYLLSEKEKNEK